MIASDAVSAIRRAICCRPIKVSSTELVIDRCESQAKLILFFHARQSGGYMSSDTVSRWHGRPARDLTHTMRGPLQLDNRKSPLQNCSIHVSRRQSIHSGSARKVGSDSATAARGARPPRVQ